MLNISAANPTPNPKNSYAHFLDHHRDDYERALRLERRLRAVDHLARIATMFVRPADEMCYGCAWELAVKPLMYDLVGWGRGYAPKNAVTPTGPFPEPRDMSQVIADIDKGRVPATTEDERWMRTSEAYDAIAFTLLYALYEADPGNGCGFHRGNRMSHSA